MLAWGTGKSLEIIGITGITSLIGSGEMQREAFPLGVPSWLASSFRDIVRFLSLRPLKLLRSAGRRGKSGNRWDSRHRLNLTCD
jgi:hypothetical protein